MIQATSLLQFSRLSHGFSQVSDGNMDYRFGLQTEVHANRQRLLGKLGLSLDHSIQQRGLEADIHVITPADKGVGMHGAETGIRANAFITSEPGIGLFLCIADCLPIIMYDPTNHVIALLHAARNSTNLNLASHVVKQLSDQFGTQPRDIWVAFGPTIRPESYLFPAEIINSLVSSEWQPYLSLQPDGRIAVDVAAFNKDQLIESGVPVSQIEDQGLNTRTDPHYFSHVRSQQDHLPEGRFAAVVALKP